MKAKAAEDYLRALGLWDRYQHATTLNGRQAYEDRFVSGIAATVFSIVGLHPIKVKEKRHRYAEFIDFLAFSGFLPMIEDAWLKKKEKYGILTPPRPPFNQDFTNWVIEYCKPEYRYVDVYSAPQRYPEIIDYIKNSPGFKTVVELGCGPADFLLDIADPLIQSIGIDLLPLRQAVHDEMMYRNRWMSDGTERWLDHHKAEVKAKAHMKAIKKADIKIIRGDVLNMDTIKKAAAFITSWRRFAVSLNVMYPHYDAIHIQKLIQNMLLIDPEYIIIGGGDPALEFAHPVTGEIFPRKHFCIFKLKRKTIANPYGPSLQSGDPFDSRGNTFVTISLEAELVI